MELIEQMVTIYHNYGFETEVLVASVRAPHPHRAVGAAGGGRGHHPVQGAGAALQAPAHRRRARPLPRRLEEDRQELRRVGAAGFLGTRPPPLPPGRLYRFAWGLYLVLALAGVIWIGVQRGVIPLSLFLDRDRWWLDLGLGPGRGCCCSARGGRPSAPFLLRGSSRRGSAEALGPITPSRGGRPGRCSPASPRSCSSAAPCRGRSAGRRRRCCSACCTAVRARRSGSGRCSPSSPARCSAASWPGAATFSGRSSDTSWSTPSTSGAWPAAWGTLLDSPPGEARSEKES